MGETVAMTANDPSRLYSAERADLIETLRSLTRVQAGSPVPACPGWTVKDVAAHLSGLVAETLANVPLPRGSDDATARQVAGRAGLTLDDVCDEWESNASAFGQLAVDDPGYAMLLTCDLVVHAHDIAEALQRPIDETSVGTIAAAERYLGMLQERAAEQLDISLTVELIEATTLAATGGATHLHLAAKHFEVLRCLTGRRTLAQVSALGWTGDPSALLSSCFVQYGSLID